MSKWSHVLPIPSVPPVTIIPRVSSYGRYSDPNYGVHTLMHEYACPYSDRSWRVFYSYSTPIALAYFSPSEGGHVAITDGTYGDANTVTTRRHISSLCYYNFASKETVAFPKGIFENVVLHNVFYPNSPIKATLNDNMYIIYSPLVAGEDPYPLELSSVEKFHDAMVAYNRSQGAKKAAITRKKNKIVREARRRERQERVNSARELAETYPNILANVGGLLGG